MDLRLTTRYQQIDSAKSAVITTDLIAWLREYFATRVNSRVMDERRCIPPHVLLDFGNRGLFGFHVGVADGGLGLKCRDWCRLLEQMSSLDSSVAQFFNINAQAVRTYAVFGTEPMKRDLLPRLAAGRIIASFAVTEPLAGADFLGLQAEAVEDGTGRGWELTGEKIFIGNAGWAGCFTVLAKIRGKSGLTAFAVDRSAAGLSVGTEHDTMGVRALVQNKVHLRKVQVSRAEVLGKPGQGIEVALDTMSFTRLTLAAHHLGAMKFCAQLMYRYASRRKIGTGGLMDNAITISSLSEVVARIEATEALLNRLLDTLDEGGAVSFEQAAVCKIVASEFLGWIADRAMQLLGGRGYEESNALPQILRDARVFRILEGPTEVLAWFVGKRLRASGRLVPFGEEHGEALRGRSQIAAGAEAIGSGAKRLDLSDEQKAQWVDYRRGILACWASLAVVYGQRQHASPRVQAWLDERVASREKGFWGPTDCWLPSNEIQAAIASFHDDIGEVKQTLPGLNDAVDELLGPT